MGEPEEAATNARVGGISRGEWGWRLVPLADDRAMTTLVPFTTTDLGPGVWAQLQADASAARVTIRLRGKKSSGHRDTPSLYRSLSVYSTSSFDSQKHFLRIHDAAIDAGIDPTLFMLPDNWRPMPQATALAAGCATQESARARWCDVDLADSESGEMSDLDPEPSAEEPVKVEIITIGIRFLCSLPEFNSLDASTQTVIKDLVREVEASRADPGDNRVANALQLFGYGTFDLAQPAFMHDPEKNTQHTGLSFEVQSFLWKQNEVYFQQLFSRVKAMEGRSLRVLIYCRSGRHRSAASAEVLSHVLDSVGYSVTVTHAMDYWWKFVPCQKRARRRGVQCASCSKA